MTFHGIQDSAGILYHWHPPCASGPQWEVAWSVVRGFSRDMFAGFPRRSYRERRLLLSWRIVLGEMTC